MSRNDETHTQISYDIGAHTCCSSWSSRWIHLLKFTAANSHGPIAVVNKLEMTDVEVINCYGKTRSEEFLAMNPCHCAPTVELEDGTGIWESNTVMRFLCDSSPNGESLYPKDPIKRARVDLALDWRQTAYYPCLPSIGYIIFGMEQSTEKARDDFKNLLDIHFKTLLDVFLKDTQFIYSDTPTIADLAVAAPLTFIKGRSKFWDAVPDAVKKYQQAVFESFPETAENFAMLDGLYTGCQTAGFDAEP